MNEKNVLNLKIFRKLLSQENKIKEKYKIESDYNLLNELKLSSEGKKSEHEKNFESGKNYESNFNHKRTFQIVGLFLSLIIYIYIYNGYKVFYWEIMFKLKGKEFEEKNRERVYKEINEEIEKIYLNILLKKLKHFLGLSKPKKVLKKEEDQEKIKKKEEQEKIKAEEQKRKIKKIEQEQKIKEEEQKIKIIQKKNKKIKKPIKSPHHHHNTLKSKIKFSDVKGLDEILPEFTEIVDFMKNKKKYKKIGADLPKGILLTGPPGCGKTFIVKALAGETNWNFFYNSGSEFDDKYVGSGARKIKDLFEKARKNAPAIIFIDEIDSVAGKREKNMGFSDQTINQLLTEMDGFEQKEDILVIGSTNLTKAIDKAILRPGRFDKIINFSLPSKKGRREILEYYLSKIKCDIKQIDFPTFVNRTVGFTPADLKNLVNIAAISAVKKNLKKTTQVELDESFDRILMGIKGNNLNKGYSQDDLKKIAIHEIGHTLISIYNKRFLNVHKVTILPVGGSLGHTAFIPKLEDNERTCKSILGLIDISLGGRVAEEVFLGEDEITMGCGDDLRKATQFGYDLVLKSGLDSDSFYLSEDKKKISKQTRLIIDNKVQKVLNDRYKIVKKIILENRKKIELLVERLVDKETLQRDEILELFEKEQVLEGVEKEVEFVENGFGKIENLGNFVVNDEKDVVIEQNENTFFNTNEENVINKNENDIINNIGKEIHNDKIKINQNEINKIQNDIIEETKKISEIDNIINKSKNPPKININKNEEKKNK